MSMLESILIALDNLRVNKMRAFLTIIGIVVGVGSVVTVVSIGQAGKTSIVSEISKYGEGFFLVTPNFQNGGNLQQIGLTMQDLEQIKRLPDIRVAAGMISYGSEVTVRKDTEKLSVNGTTADITELENINMLAGRFYSPGEVRARQRVIVVESKFAEKVYGSAQAALHKKLPIDGKIYRIIGVYESSESFLGGLGGERYTVYVPVTIDPTLNRIDYMELQATSGSTLDKAINETKKLLAKRHNTDVSSYMTQSGKDLEKQVGSVFTILQTIIGSIAGISLFVGGIGVMNIMLVSVTERTREIGIRKAIGAKPGTIMAQFLIEAVTLSILGGILGALLGLGGAGLFSFIIDWPFIISWWAIFLAFAFSAGVGIFFGLYPANKAARLQPIDALRYE
ncbi:MAG TPA: ABC transporter permease [Bacilli bacterium]